MDTPSKFETWGILEIMGHLRLAGRISEQSIAGTGFVRIDIPGDGDAFNTRIFGTASIYSITPTDEPTACAVAAHYRTPPIQQWELLPVGKPSTRIYPLTESDAAAWEDAATEPWKDADEDDDEEAEDA